MIQSLRWVANSISAFNGDHSASATTVTNRADPIAGGGDGDGRPSTVLMMFLLLVLLCGGCTLADTNSQGHGLWGWPWWRSGEDARRAHAQNI